MLDEIKKIILESGANVIRIALYQDGIWQGETLRLACPCQNCYSVSKSFTATAIGIAQDMGLLTVEDPILKYFPDERKAVNEGRMERVKIRHLLSHTMGNGKGWLFEQDMYTYGTDDWVRLILSTPLELEPGEKFVYSNTTFYLLSCIIHRASGMTMDAFLYRYLFKPLDIHEYA